MIPDDSTLCIEDLGAQPNGILGLKVASTEPDTHPLKVYDQKDKYLSAADIITVHVSLDAVDGRQSSSSSSHKYKEIVVEIERSSIKKPFLGGFRSRLTDKVNFNLIFIKNLKEKKNVSQSIINDYAHKIQNKVKCSFFITLACVYNLEIDRVRLFIE